jgi:TRAP-type C4-dicarboxylate transport system permease small subunit
MQSNASNNAVGEAVKFVDKVNEIILFPLIALLIAVAFLVFLWGCAQYIFNASNPSAKEEGIRHITWGIIGLLVMVTAWTILLIATATFGLDDELNCAQNPSASGCENAFQIPAR